MRAGLLMTVVKWGKVELFNRVVNDSNFDDQRSPALVQQAFQLGLKLAGNTKQFDVKLIELLLQHNANPADVFISDLFRLVGPTNPDGVVDDAFGYLASLAHAREVDIHRAGVSGLGARRAPAHLARLAVLAQHAETRRLHLGRDRGRPPR